MSQLGHTNLLAWRQAELGWSIKTSFFQYEITLKSPVINSFWTSLQNNRVLLSLLITLL